LLLEDHDLDIHHFEHLRSYNVCIFDRFVNIEPSAVEGIVHDPNGLSDASLNNSSIDGKLLSTEVGDTIHNVLDESTELITNISTSKYR
jgi:hypothetical protein